MSTPITPQALVERLSEVFSRQVAVLSQQVAELSVMLEAVTKERDAYRESVQSQKPVEPKPWDGPTVVETPVRTWPGTGPEPDSDSGGFQT